MPDILLLHFDPLENDLLQKLAEDNGFRVKVTASFNTAQEWIKISDFSAVLASMTITAREQRDLADLLWRGNPESTFVLFDLDPDHIVDPGEARLLGAEVAAGPGAMAHLKEIMARLPSRRSLSGNDFRILVVEDLDSPRYVICLLLEELGYAVVDGVESAKKAINELETNPQKYSCVLTDIRMPEVTGRDLIGMIRSNPKLQHLPVIVLTAYGTSDALIDCLEAGASGFLVKPPKRADLLRELSRARRIAADQASPRLADPGEVEAIRRILEGRGLV